MKSKSLVLSAAAVLLLALPLIATGAAPQKFMAHLMGNDMVPPVQSQAMGNATFEVSPDGKSIKYQLTVQNLKDADMAHIHLAAAGQPEGAPVVWLYPATPPPVLKPGTFTGTLAEGIVTPAKFEGALKGKPLRALVQDLETGKACVVVHTKANPQGEIRGQIQAAK
jgi:hypothetical protein